MITIEPLLQPVPEGLHFEHTSTCQDREVRVDVACHGLFGNSTVRSLVDICTFSHLAPSYSRSTGSDPYRYHESRRIQKYGERITSLERATFFPFVISTAGGLGPSAHFILKRIAQLQSRRRDIP